MSSSSSSPLVSQSQAAPTRYFTLIPLRDVGDFVYFRELSYGNLVAKITGKGGIPADYDVRPFLPGDDQSQFQGSTTTNYAPDWSIAAASVTVTNGLFSGAGNLILGGQMPQDRFFIMYGTEVQTPGTPPEIAWKFTTGSNIKTGWMLQDVLGWEYPRCATLQQPTWGPSELIGQYLIAVAAAPVVDVHYTLWAEPQGTTITASAVRA
jgi:hypothetical protein